MGEKQTPLNPPDRATTISLNPPDRATTISRLITMERPIARFKYVFLISIPNPSCVQKRVLSGKMNVADHVSSRSISAALPISYCLHVKVGSASGRQVSPVIPEVSRRCDITLEVETATYRVYRVLSQQVCVLDKR